VENGSSFTQADTRALSLPALRWSMEILGAVVILVIAAVIAVLLMVGVARIAPRRGFVSDPVPAASVYGVIGVAFAVLLAFVVFLAFEGYLRSLEGASREAVAVTQLVRTTRLFPEEHGAKLRGQLACYARAVVADEWPAMAAGGESELVDTWLERIESTIDRMPVASSRTEVALAHWLDEMAERREGRRSRLHQAVPLVPPAVWLTLVLGAALTVGFLLVYANRADRWWVQGLMIGSVTLLVVAGLLVVVFLDHPFQRDGAYVAPDEMQTSIRLMDERSTDALAVERPCDEEGTPVQLP
jgi:hypothetical protein